MWGLSASPVRLWGMALALVDWAMGSVWGNAMRNWQQQIYKPHDLRMGWTRGGCLHRDRGSIGHRVWKLAPCMQVLLIFGLLQSRLAIANTFFGIRARPGWGIKCSKNGGARYGNRTY